MFLHYSFIETIRCTYISCALKARPEEIREAEAKATPVNQAGGGGGLGALQRGRPGGCRAWPDRRSETEEQKSSVSCRVCHVDPAREAVTWGLTGHEAQPAEAGAAQGWCRGRQGAPVAPASGRLRMRPGSRSPQVLGGPAPAGWTRQAMPCYPC